MQDFANDHMKVAIEEARAAAERGEVPVGAVIVDKKGDILAKSGNQVEELGDPTAHAEILVMRHAAAIVRSPRLTECILYVTLEPCTMCAAAASLARIEKIVFGAYDPKGGGIEHGARFYTQSTCHHIPEVVGGVEETVCSKLLKEFFAEKRG